MFIIRCLAQAAAALLGGLAIYLLFRSGTRLHLLLGADASAAAGADFPGAAAVRYLLPDFCWGYALCCTLAAIFPPTRRGLIFAGVLSAGCGMIWEGLQLIGAAAGTADIADCAAYLAAAFAACTINILLRGKQK